MGKGTQYIDLLGARCVAQRRNDLPGASRREAMQSSWASRRRMVMFSHDAILMQYTKVIHDIYIYICIHMIYVYINMIYLYM